MKPHRSSAVVPPWMNDARLRRNIAEAVRRRRVKRLAELARLERDVRLAEMKPLSLMERK